VFGVAHGARKTRKTRKTSHFGPKPGLAYLSASPFEFTVPKHCFGKKVNIFHLDMGPFCEKIGFDCVSAKNGPFCVFSEGKKSTMAAVRRSVAEKRCALRTWSQ